MTGLEDLLALISPALEDLQGHALEIAAGAAGIACVCFLHSLVLHGRLRRLRRLTAGFEGRIAALEWTEENRLNASLRRPVPVALATPAAPAASPAVAKEPVSPKDDEFEELIESLQRA